MYVRAIQPWRVRLGVAMLAAALALTALLPATALGATLQFASPNGTTIASATTTISFISPSSKAYFVVGSNYLVSWAEPFVPTGRQVIEDWGALDINGGCGANVVWKSVAAIVPIKNSIKRKLAADRCYRWTINLFTGPDTYQSKTSPSLRTLSVWTGKFNLYRKIAFSSQQAWDYCVAASTQMMFNFIKGQSKHGYANQKKYYKYARDTGLQPKSVPGADPLGWANTLRHFGGGKYSDVQSPSFKSALNLAVTRMRLTGKPVGLIVRHGDHAWVMNGYTAVGDPASGDFTVTGVYIMGPWYPRKDGYDPAPNKYYTTARFKKIFTVYDDPFGSAKWSIWEGSWVTINP